jgi:hypothetical protein
MCIITSIKDTTPVQNAEVEMVVQQPRRAKGTP